MNVSLTFVYLQGQYKTDRCTGKTMNDTEKCAYCPLCPSGRYWKTGCDGSTFSPVGQCEKCDSCGGNQFVASFSGCLGHRASKVKYICSNCSTCAVNQQHAPACDGTPTIDPPCVPCNSCPAGQYISMDPVTKVCSCALCRTTCGVGEYRNGNGCRGSGQKDDFCLPCSKASTCDLQTQYLSGSCTGLGTVDVQQCSNCSGNTCDTGPTGVDYFNNVARCNATAAPDSWCTPCKRCTVGFNTGALCSGTTDSVCTPCASNICQMGKYESAPCQLQVQASCEWCTICSPQSYDSSIYKCSDGKTNRVCTRCTQSCQPGYEMVIPCSAQRDAVCAPSLGKWVAHSYQARSWLVYTHTPAHRKAGSYPCGRSGGLAHWHSCLLESTVTT